ncbi:MAG: apolipoprotein N-acyltransferase, partial [Bacteroidota bacterium]
HSPSPWLSFGDAYAAFLAMSVVGGYWALLHQEPTQALRAGALLLCLPATMGLPFVLGWVIRRRLGPTLGFATLAASAVAVEHALGGWAVPLPWAQVGHTQLASLTLLQLTDLSGISTVSAWLWVIGGLGAWVLIADSYVKPVLTNRTVALLVLSIVFILPFLYGAYRLERVNPDLRSLRIGVVQPSLSPQQWLHSDPAARIDHLASLSASLLGQGSTPIPGASAPATGTGPVAQMPRWHDIDLVVWPELALPAYTDAARTERLYRRVNAWAESQQVALLAGAATAPAGASDRYNSALLFDPSTALQRSDQTRTHPAFDGARFVEPPTEVPQVQPDWRIAQTERPFAQASAKQPLRLSHSQIGPLIGFETLFSQEARTLVQQGSDVLLVLSQDDWWGTKTASDMHFALARLRAIETRRPVVVSTVNGATGVVGPNGMGQKHASTEQPVGTYRVLLSASEARYVRHGNVVLSGSLLLLMLLSVAFTVRGIRRRSKPEVAPPPAPPADENELAPSYTGGLTWPEDPPAYDDAALDDPDLDRGDLDRPGFDGPDFGGSDFDTLASFNAPSAAPFDPATSVQDPHALPVTNYLGRLSTPFPGDGGGAGNSPPAPSVPQAPYAPPPADRPWYASPSSSSSPPAPPDADASSTPWASPSRFTSPVTPKTSPPTSRPEKP